MLEKISAGFRAAKQRLSGEAELTEQNIEEALREVRRSLLEADVEFNVVKSFLAQVKEHALGEVVRLKASAAGRAMRATPTQHFVRICQKELAALMGPVDNALRFAKKGPTGVMMVGLQGSGKTTTVGKLASYLVKHHRRPLLVAADVYRPAAVEQLRVIGERAGVPVYSEPGAARPPEICERAVGFARERGRDVVIFDTAGRLAIDEPLMQELEDTQRRVTPGNVFLVCDAMIGQDAVTTARAFHARLNLDGVILTKFDGDARGGAALSIKQVTGTPIKFLGVGEQLDKLEEFRPEGLASRILGMGDIVGLMQDFEEVVDAEKAERDAERMLKGKFDMQDFLDQIRVIQKMGSLRDLLEKMPFFPDGLPDGMQLDGKQLKRTEAIISSMTADERRHPERFITTSWEEVQEGGKTRRRRTANFELRRIRRVAAGSGCRENDVAELLNTFAGMRQMMLTIGAETGLLGKIPGLKQFAQMRKFMGVDVGQIVGAMKQAQTLERPAAPAPPRGVERAKDKRKRKAARQARKKNKRR